MKEKYDEEIIGERWEPVVGYKGWYEVSDIGRARNVADRKHTFVGKILKQRIISSGYCGISLCRNGDQHDAIVHRLVMAAFVGQCPEGKEVNHKDGDKTNNRLDNLEYVTQSENMIHAFDTGLHSLGGEKNNMSKLTEENVHEIRRLLRAGLTHKSISALFNVSRSCISLIATGERWAYLKEEEEE